MNPHLFINLTLLYARQILYFCPLLFFIYIFPQNMFKFLSRDQKINILINSFLDRYNHKKITFVLIIQKLKSLLSIYTCNIYTTCVLIYIHLLIHHKIISDEHRKQVNDE